MSSPVSASVRSERVARGPVGRVARADERCMRGTSQHSLKLVLSLGAVYFVWGSSFLFTKVAVSNLPIPLFFAIRFLCAGAVLAGIARLWNDDPWPCERSDLRHFLVVGFLMVFVSNGVNAWAMQYVPSSESALLNGTAALWIAGLGVLGPRGHPLSRLAGVGLVVGFAGTVLTLLPSDGVRASRLVAELGALGACLAFSLGTLYYRSVETSVSSLMFIAMQMLCGGLMLLALAVLQHDWARWNFRPPGLLALGYLTFASSGFAFTAYGWLTRNTSPAVIGTYSYVNPAVAAYLGWQFLGEALSPLQLSGMVVIIIGVGILTVTESNLKEPKTLAEPRQQ
jgi:drug/metabolite transporter (DMT)-like permease